MIGALGRAMRRVTKGEGGFTLVEVMVSLVVMGVVATAMTRFLITSQNVVLTETLRSQTLDQARLAMDEIDKEIRSGSILYDPSLDDGISCGGYTCTQFQSLRVYTQTYGNTRTPPNQCVQWLLTTNDQLLRRAWAPGAASSLNGWHVIATGIVNRDPTATDGSTYATFWFNTPTQNRTIEVQLYVDANKGDPRSKPIFLQNAISIRNYASGDPCTPIPAT
jgi:prepilin-type N-terminal cleavage/methylation domain-containing protein